jgi:hypothetical protein
MFMCEKQAGLPFSDVLRLTSWNYVQCNGVKS